MACRPPAQGNIFPKKQLHCSYLKSDRHLSAKQAAKQAMAIFPFLIPLLYGAIGTLGLQPEQDYVIADVSQGQVCVRKIICLSGISFLRNGFSLRVHFFFPVNFQWGKTRPHLAFQRSYARETSCWQVTYVCLLKLLLTWVFAEFIENQKKKKKIKQTFYDI